MNGRFWAFPLDSCRRLARLQFMAGNSLIAKKWKKKWNRNRERDTHLGADRCLKDAPWSERARRSEIPMRMGRILRKSVVSIGVVVAFSSVVMSWTSAQVSTAEPGPVRVQGWLRLAQGWADRPGWTDESLGRKRKGRDAAGSGRRRS